MESHLDCIPCFVRQAIDAARRATSNENIHEQILRDVLGMVGEMAWHLPPPVMAQRIHRLTRKLSGNDDPYKDQKHRYNRIALNLYAELKQQVENAVDPLEIALRLALAGNVIDLGINYQMNRNLLHETIGRSLSAPLSDDVRSFYRAIDTAEKILYLGDNAGEIVFDRLLIEQLSSSNVTFAVRGHPVLNDATMTDATETGMTELVEVIDNGSDAPGTIIADCSEKFRQRFFEADLIIAKGQGNYETLSDVHQDLVFILKAKCPVIARHIGCDLGSFIVQRKTGRKSIAQSSL